MSVIPLPQVLEVGLISTDTKRLLPFFLNPVSAGFPSPADDYIETKLDLNTLLVKNPAATFYVKVSGDSMKGAGIFHGDTLVVDRSREAVDGSIVVAVVDGELTVKKLKLVKGKPYLVPENPDYKDIELKEYSEMQIWGVVSGSVKLF